MAAAHTWAQLQKRSDAELIREHDELAKYTGVGTNHYLAELRYRSHLAVSRRIENLTWIIAGLTLVVTLATIYNAIS